MFQITTQLETKKLEDYSFALNAIGTDMMPATANAVSVSTSLVKRRWIDNAKRSTGKRTGEYLAGIMNGEEYPFEGDPYKGAVINISPQARWIEEGTAPYDMKRMLFTSNKVRISAKGKRYLIIPFRHGTPSAGSHEGGVGTDRATLRAMPQAVYSMAKNLDQSRRTGSFEVHNPATNRPVVRYSYKWGGRLPGNALAKMGLQDIGRRPHWKSSPYEGMVKFPRETSTGQSIYMTFRVMSEESKGWLHPGTAPKKIAEKTAQEMQPIVVDLIEKGFVKDVKTFMGMAA